MFQEYILPLIENRGPDETSNYSIQVKNAFNETFTLYFVGSVLHLRGKLTKQPKVKEHVGCSDVFLWNGEVFGGNVKVYFNIFYQSFSIIILNVVVMICSFSWGSFV